MAAATTAGALPRDRRARDCWSTRDGRSRVLLMHLPLLVVILCSAAARAAVALFVNTPLYYPDEAFYTSLSRSIAASEMPSFLGQPVSFGSLPGAAPHFACMANLERGGRLPRCPGRRRGGFLPRRDSRSCDRAPSRLGPRCLPRCRGGSRPCPRRHVQRYLDERAVCLPDLSCRDRGRYGRYREAVASQGHSHNRSRGSPLLRADPIRLFPGLRILGAAWIASGRRSPRAALSAHPLVAGVIAAAGVAAVALGPSRVAGIYSGVADFDLSASALARWSFLNVVALAIAAGWAIVPGASIALGQLLRRGNEPERAFAALTVLVTPMVILEAAVFGAGEGRLIERYTFYIAPLIVIGFLVALSRGLLRRRSHATAAAVMVAVAVILPANGFFSSPDGQASVLFALRPLRPVLGEYASLTAIAVLALISGRGLAPWQAWPWRCDRRYCRSALCRGDRGGIRRNGRNRVTRNGSRPCSPAAGNARDVYADCPSGRTQDPLLESQPPRPFGPRREARTTERLYSFRRNVRAQRGSFRCAGNRSQARSFSTARPRLCGSTAAGQFADTGSRSSRTPELREWCWSLKGWPTGSRYLKTSGRFGAWPARDKDDGKQMLSLRLRSPSTVRQTMTFRCGSRVWTAVMVPEAGNCGASGQGAKRGLVLVRPHEGRSLCRPRECSRVWKSSVRI